MNCLRRQPRSIRIHQNENSDMLLTTGRAGICGTDGNGTSVLNVPAISLNAFQVKMHSTARNGNARFKRVDTDRITHELENRKIVIVTGFQGVNHYGDYTTLGRGGSDTTAVVTCGCNACRQMRDLYRCRWCFTLQTREWYRMHAKSKRSPTMRCWSLQTSGAKVLHNRSVEMAKKYGVELVVRSSLNTEEGTLVKEVAKVEKMLITGVAADKNTARISVMGVEDKPGTAFKIFNTLAKHNINVDIILQSVGRDGTKDITFTVSQDDLKEAMEVMEARKEALTIKEMNYNEKLQRYRS